MSCDRYIELNPVLPGLVPVALYAAWAAARHRLLRWLMLLVALLMAGLLLVSHLTLRNAYPSHPPTASAGIR